MPNRKTNADKNSGAGPKLLAGGIRRSRRGRVTSRCRPTSQPCPVGSARSASGTVIVRTVPDVHKAVKWNQPFYGHEGEGWFLAFRCYTKYVQLQFFRGTSLDPVPPKASKHAEGVTSTSTKTTTSRRASSSPGSNRQATCLARRCSRPGRPRSAGRAHTASDRPDEELQSEQAGREHDKRRGSQHIGGASRPASQGPCHNQARRSDPRP